MEPEWVAVGITIIGTALAAWAGVSAHQSKEAADASAKEAKRANDFAERPDVTLEVGAAEDLYGCLSIAFRSDTALDSLRITKTHTVIDGQVSSSGQWRVSVTSQYAAGTKDEESTITFSGVQVNRPVYVTWIPWDGHMGTVFDLRLDFDLLCVAADRQWTLARSIEHVNEPPPRVY